MQFVKIFYECAAQAMGFVLMMLARIELLPSLQMSEYQLGLLVLHNKVLCDRVVYPTLIAGLGFQFALSPNYGY
jgi:hypothetical protein